MPIYLPGDTRLTVRPDRESLHDKVRGAEAREKAALAREKMLSRMVAVLVHRLGDFTLIPPEEAASLGIYRLNLEESMGILTIKVEQKHPTLPTKEPVAT